MALSRDGYQQHAPSRNTPKVADELQDLKDYVHMSLQQAKDNFKPEDNQPYVPTTKLREYLTEEKLRLLLLRHHLQPDHWKQVRDRYLVVYVILIYIGKGEYIGYFKNYNELADDRLPFKSDQDWPIDCRPFYHDFAKAQWTFCAQKFERDQVHGIRYPLGTIFPFKCCKVLKENTDSIVCKIELHEDYNYLNRNDDDRPRTNYFVLKSRRDTQTRFHDGEVEAYRALFQPGADEFTKNMVQFYASWTCGDTSSILLEYVGGGTLTHFLQRKPAPDTQEDVFKFWENLIQIAKPLGRIHRLPDPANRHKYRQGVHHDIKPDNILVSAQHGPSLFDVTFKIADLGLTAFVLSDTHGQDPLQRDAYGTQVYSAPEYYRSEQDTYLLQTIKPARPSKDIWSLGCVFSEAAYWSVFGPTGHARYQTDRRDATKNNLKNTAYSGCFHDGMRILSVVRDAHFRAADGSRTGVDKVIHKMVHLVEDMLSDENSRPDAVKVYEKMIDHLQMARSHSQSTSDNSPWTGPGRANTMPIRQRPPFLPNSMGVGVGLDSSEWLPTPTSKPVHSSPTQQVSPPNQPCQPIGREPRRDHVGHFSTPPNPPSRNTSSTHANQDITRIVSCRYTHSPVSENPPTPTLDNQHNTQPFDYSSRHGEPQLDPGHSTVSMQVPRPATHDLLARDATQFRSTPEPDPELPHATIQEVLEWIRKRKNDKMSSDLKGREWLNRLYGRDHIFLIDDSESMKKHWETVKNVWDALAYLVKKMDKDGIEIRFANSRTQNGQHKDRDSLRRRLKNVKPGGQCNMELALSDLLPDCYPSDPPSTRRRSLSLRQRPKERSGVNIYILTDGVWSQEDDPLCGVQKHIRLCVDRMNAEAQLKYVGIQFIRFGNDPIGKERLERLDNGLQQYDVKMDIIDTEPADGNVFKMLLGSTDSAWDRLDSQ